MIDAKSSKQILKKIFASKEFASAKNDQDFLRYLVNATLKSQIPKETTIAIDIFGKKSDFNPATDSIVRSRIYALRKKLETYYLTEGKNDKVKLVIPKGHYKIEFVTSSDHKTLKSIKGTPYYVMMAFIIFFAVFTIIFWQKSLLLERQIKTLKIIGNKNPVWSDFLQSELPTLIVIGDYFVFEEPHAITGRERLIRDVEINSKEDFVKYFEGHPEEKDKFRETTITYLGTEVPLSLYNLFKVFKGTDKKIEIKLASDLLWEDIQQKNIIFIGHFKTLRIMRHFFDNLHIQFQLFPHKIYCTNGYSDTLETITLESYFRYGFSNDYAIVAKLPGGHNNTIMLFTSFSAFGKIEAVKKLIDPSFPNELIKRKMIKKTISPYFEILFKIHGLEEAGFYTEILRFDEINPKNILEDNKNNKLANGEIESQH